MCVYGGEGIRWPHCEILLFISPELFTPLYSYFSHSIHTLPHTLCLSASLVLFISSQSSAASSHSRRRQARRSATALGPRRARPPALGVEAPMAAIAVEATDSFLRRGRWSIRGGECGQRGRKIKGREGWHSDGCRQRRRGRWLHFIFRRLRQCPKPLSPPQQCIPYIPRLQRRSRWWVPQQCRLLPHSRSLIPCLAVAKGAGGGRGRGRGPGSW